MPFSSDHLLDRLRLKRRLRVWQLSAIVAVVALVLALGARFNVLGGEDYIARLWIEGVIRDDVDRDTLIAELAKDPKVRAVVVRINSPGGTVVGGEALYRNLRELAEVKPVVAVMGELATSAGYMTALAADHIVAREGTLTGSIGVLMQSANVTGLMEKIGVEPVVIKSAPLKATPNPMEPVTPQVRAATKEIVMDMYEMFLQMVVLRRNLEEGEARALADGRVFTGRQALKLGLIDENGAEAKALSWLQGEKNIAQNLDVLDVYYEDRDIFARAKGSLITSLFDKSLISEGLNLDGLVSVWQPVVQ